jgi:glycosyltransferase involved in cell wall biosynthesis
MLESMAVGAFPIQSSPACTGEWLVHGRNGLVVHPEDPEDVAGAIRTAMCDDALVDDAARENMRIAEERLDEKVVRPRVIERYRLASVRATIRASPGGLEHLLPARRGVVT